MESFKNFFRGQEDGFIFPKYGLIHILILIFFIIGLSIIYNSKFGLKDEKKNDKFLKILASIILIDQIVLYTWQFASGRFSIDMSLPLYHCRTAVIFLIIGIFTQMKFFKVMTMFWGSVGSLFAMLIPDLYQYHFPHYTNFQFFIVHIILGFVVFDYLFVKKIKITIQELKKVLIFTNIYNIVLVIFNIALLAKYPNINYGYMAALPGNITIINKFMHSIIMLLVFNIGTILVYKIFSRKYEEKNLWEITKSLVK